MKFSLEEIGEVVPALLTLESLLTEGLDSLPRRLRMALESDDYSGALSEANQHYAKQGPGDRDAALAYAVLLVNRQLCDEALGVLRRSLQEHAQDVGLQLAQAEALIMKGEFEAAEGLLEALQSVTSSTPKHWSFMGDMYLDMGHDDEALACYQAALDRGLESIDVASRVGEIFADREDFAEAATFFGRAARWAVTDPELWRVTAETHMESGGFEEATYALKRMLQEKEHDERGWLLMGVSQIQLGNLAAAADAFQEVVAVNPHNSTAWEQLGHVLLSSGHGEEALQAFLEAIEHGGDEEVDLLNSAARAAYEIGDVEAARGWSDRAMALDPEDGETLFNRGGIFLTLRRGEDARRALLPLLQMVPVDEKPRILGALAVSEMMSGRDEEAFEHIDAAQRQTVDVEPLWVSAFAEELLRTRGARATQEFLDTVKIADPTWEVVRGMLGYLCCALMEDDDEADVFARGFLASLKQAPEVVPVMWDFEGWEVFAFRLQRRYEEVFDMMLGILEGRREIEDMEELLS